MSDRTITHRAVFVWRETHERPELEGIICPEDTPLRDVMNWAPGGSYAPTTREELPGDLVQRHGETLAEFRQRTDALARFFEAQGLRY